MKSVFITGAGSGMGREGAKLFHANGWRVGAVDRNDDGLAALSRELGAERLWTRVVDVTDKAALDAALADFCAGNAGGGLDMMWNNAGIGESGWFEDVPYEAAMRVVDVNYKAVLTGAYGALPYLKKTPGQSDVLDVVVGGHLRHAADRGLLVDQARGQRVDRGAQRGMASTWCAGRRRAARSDRHRDPHHDTQPLRRWRGRRCPPTSSAPPRPRRA